jgi:hypothetical protein
MHKANGFILDGVISCLPKGSGNLLESSFFPAFQNVFLGGPGALSEAGGSHFFSHLSGQVRLNRMSPF